MADIEPKFYRAMTMAGPFDFEGMPGTTTKKWGELRVQGYEGKLFAPKQPRQIGFLPFVNILAWVEVSQEEVMKGPVPAILSPHGGNA